MKKMKHTLFVIMAIAAVVLASGCLGQKASPSEYFPVKEGMEWSYKIDFGSTEPLVYFEVIWGSANNYKSRFYTTTIFPSLKNIQPDCCHLKIKIQEITPDQKPNMDRIYLAISRDDFGFYEDSLSPSWIKDKIDNSEQYKIIRYVIYPGSQFSVWEDSSVFTLQILFFTPQGIGDEMALSKYDKIKFVGYENNVPGYEGAKSMHFERRVDNVGMIEDTWFAPGKGLVRLEQKVGGEPSMTWVLESFKTS